MSYVNSIKLAWTLTNSPKQFLSVACALTVYKASTQILQALETQRSSQIAFAYRPEAALAENSSTGWTPYEEHLKSTRFMSRVDM